MKETYLDMENMQQMFLYAQDLCSWCLDAEGGLLDSNSPSQEFFYNIFSVGSGLDMVSRHFAHHTAPAIYSDKTGIAWIAAALFSGETLERYYLLGPFFTVDATEKYIRQLCSRLKVSQHLLDDLFKQLKLLPTIPLTTAHRYSIMLHYCVTGMQCLPADIPLLSEISDPSPDESWGDTNWHGTWAAEQHFFKTLSEGSISDISSALTAFSAGRVGTLCPDDPLRQAKDELIVMITLVSRAAMVGGVSPEGAYNLADDYVQRIEACSHVSDVQNYSIEMLSVYLQRIRQVRKNRAYSLPIASCMEYIETHLMEKISLENMAGEIGYTSYYLSSKFQKETGCTINQYIKRAKIEKSKELLKNPLLSISDVSERLAFSSPSYFSSVFKKITGMSPGDYLTGSGADDK